jgi:hypothetical protein
LEMTLCKSHQRFSITLFVTSRSVFIDLVQVSKRFEFVRVVAS